MTVLPDPWVVQQVSHIVSGGRVLDLACGKGRHSRYLLQQGFKVIAVDKNISALQDIQGDSALEVVQVDLETEPGWQHQQKFDGIVVTNYLHRPLLPKLIQWLATDGTLIYQTFMMGDESLGGVKNPNFLLRENELLDVFSGKLSVISFWQGFIEQPRPAMIQRICCQASKLDSRVK